MSSTQTYGEWELATQDPVAEGGQGTTYLVERPRDGMRAVLKLFTGGDDAHRLESYLNELRWLKRLNHPNIADYLDSAGTPVEGETPSAPLWIVTKVVGPADVANRPRTLTDWLGYRSGITPAQARGVVAGCCSAISYLHTLDPPVVHRDIKPDNFLVEEVSARKLSIWLADFALAMEGPEARQSERKADSDPTGTPGFVAPELSDPNTGFTAASDVFALGVTMTRVLDSLTGGRSGKGGGDSDAGAASVKSIEAATDADPQKRISVRQLEKALTDALTSDDFDLVKAFTTRGKPSSPGPAGSGKQDGDRTL